FFGWFDHKIADGVGFYKYGYGHASRASGVCDCENDDNQPGRDDDDNNDYAESDGWGYRGRWQSPAAAGVVSYAVWPRYGRLPE
ncbi:hypothetical protein, partial [Clostridium perfringens]